jgi:hypothetical protein
MRVLKGEEKTKIKYNIDEFKIDSGTFEFKKNDINLPSPPVTKKRMGGVQDGNISSRNITVHLKNISSESGMKTDVEASAIFLGTTVNLKGWAYLKNEPKTFAISIVSDDVSLDEFKEILSRNGISTDKTRINFSIHAEGDTEEQLRFQSQFHVAGARSDFLNKEIKDIQIDTDGSFNIREDALNIESLLLRADHVAKVQMRAIIKDIRKDPSYDVTFIINTIDLSAFNVDPYLQTGGVVTADTIHVTGELKKNEVRFSGGMRCTDCALKSDTDAVKVKNETRASPSDTQVAVHNEPDGKVTNTEKMPYNISAEDVKVSYKGTISASGFHGNGAVDATGIKVSKVNDTRNILKDAYLNSEEMT